MLTPENRDGKQHPYSAGKSSLISIHQYHTVSYRYGIDDLKVTAFRWQNFAA